MKAWLAARAEEEKRRQEEERTRQESILFERRKTELDILKESLRSGIPPPAVPLMFAGMAGGPHAQSAVEWAFQLLNSQYPQLATAPPQQQLLTAGPSTRPGSRRGSQVVVHGQHPGTAGGVPLLPGSVQPSSYVSYSQPPSGPPTHSRGYSVQGVRSAGAVPPSLPSLNTNVQGSHPGLQAHMGMAPAQQPPAQAPSQEAQPSPPILFHHWHPPGQPSGGVPPVTPSSLS